MEIAKYLDANPPFQVLSNDTPQDIEESMDNHRLWRKSVVHMLNSIVFELTIKVIWELDHNQQCRYTHNISSLYSELKEKSRRELRDIYLKKSRQMATLEATDKQGNQTMLGNLVDFQSFEDALASNEDTMKNFKYDGVFKGKSSVMGSVIWNSETIWTLPPLQNPLPETLYYYARDRIQATKQQGASCS